MSIVACIVGITIPTALGWLLVRLTETHAPVLYTYERWVVAFVLGVTALMFLFFVAEISGFLQFTASNFLLISTVFLIGLGMLYMRLKVYWPNTTVALPNRPILHKKIKIGLAILAAWTTLKILNVAFLLIASPPYLDDVFNNWNMRGKMYYITQELELTMQIGNDITSNSGVSSYPPTVPLVKTWLSTLAGTWNEGVVNAPHILWYISALLLVFFFLLRHTNMLWAGIGVYGLSSIPIYTLHGAFAYADIFVSVTVFLVVTFLYNAMASHTDKESLSWLRLAGISAALLVFTKNEALVLHLPVCVLLYATCLYFLQKKEVLSSAEVRQNIFHNGIALACVLVPWLIFKWANNLPFGNAKSLTSTAIAWQEGALQAIGINTFFEGNWILLFPIFIGLICYKWREVFRTKLSILATYSIVLICLQLPLYVFTSLSTEAILQTGLARGFVQLTPLMVVLVVLLLSGKYKMNNA